MIKNLSTLLKYTPVHLGTLITVANCSQLSHLLSEVFNTISNQIICQNRTYTTPSQPCLCLIPLFEKQEWHNDSKTIPHVVLSYDIMKWGASKFLCSNYLQFCFTSALHYQ